MSRASPDVPKPPMLDIPTGVIKKKWQRGGEAGEGMYQGLFVVRLFVSVLLC
jgi:hypothetical protein